MGIHLLCGWRWQCHTLKRCLLQSMPKSTLEGTYTVCLPGQVKSGTSHCVAQFPLSLDYVAGSLGILAMFP